jgi:hypothetical protein
MRFSLFSQLNREVQLLLTGYPDFAYLADSSAVRPQRPVFVFHTINPDEFAKQLDYLSSNGYRTLSCDEYIDELSTAPRSGVDGVLLTVDDGRSSFWRYGFPLLKRRGLKATLFIIPGRTPEGEGLRPNLEDVESGNCSLWDVEQADPEDTSLCSWAELRAMSASGLVDIQSHSLYHREVFVSSRIVDFVDLDTPLTAFETPTTPYLEVGRASDHVAQERFLGLPLYDAAPLFTAERLLLPSIELREHCRTAWNADGGGSDPRGWKRRMRASIRKRFRDGGLTEVGPRDIARSMREDLAEATRIIQDRLGSENAGLHLCFPYGAGSDEAVTEGKHVGLRSAFWGAIPGQRANTPDTDPFHLVRIKSDFLLRLPGDGRQTLHGVYWHKLKRRFRGDRVY